MDIQQLIQLTRDTPNDNELGKKLREWYFQTQTTDTKKKYVNPYNGKIEEH